MEHFVTNSFQIVREKHYQREIDRSETETDIVISLTCLQSCSLKIK